jgi:hypothetical protein
VKPGSGERRLLLGQAPKAVLKVNLISASRAELCELGFKIPYSGAKERHLIEEPAVGSRCNITDQGLGHLKGLHGQDVCAVGPQSGVRALKGGMG